MGAQKINSIDSEDAEGLLTKIEQSFDIQFGDDELTHITTLGELCDHIADKIQLENTTDCTTQQAFYELRNAISITLSIGFQILTPDTPLNVILPRQSRRKKISELESSLGFQLNILRPPQVITTTLIILLLASIVGVFFKWQHGLAGLLISLAGLWLSDKIGNEFSLQTVGQLAEKMARENYLKSRRNPRTVNKNEIEKLLINWLSEDLAMDKRTLTRESRFE